jgi:BMFP domain-containing protein YqiC
MPKPDNQLLDDLMTLGGNALGTLLGARHEWKAQAKPRLASLARNLGLVSREEFDAAFAMLAKARAFQEELSERLEALEKHMSSAKPAHTAAKANLPLLKKRKARRSRS